MPTYLKRAAVPTPQNCVDVDSADEAIEVSDAYAPEHLEVMTANNDHYLTNLRNYGSLFVGEESTAAYGPASSSRRQPIKS